MRVKLTENIGQDIANEGIIRKIYMFHYEKSGGVDNGNSTGCV